MVSIPSVGLAETCRAWARKQERALDALPSAQDVAHEILSFRRVITPEEVMRGEKVPVCAEHCPFYSDGQCLDEFDRGRTVEPGAVCTASEAWLLGQLGPAHRHDPEEITSVHPGDAGANLTDEAGAWLAFFEAERRLQARRIWAVALLAHRRAEMWLDYEQAHLNDDDEPAGAEEENNG